jgi:hypothetical protein
MLCTQSSWIIYTTNMLQNISSIIKQSLKCSFYIFVVSPRYLYHDVILSLQNCSQEFMIYYMIYYIFVYSYALISYIQFCFSFKINMFRIHNQDQHLHFQVFKEYLHLPLIAWLFLIKIHTSCLFDYISMIYKWTFIDNDVKVTKMLIIK